MTKIRFSCLDVQLVSSDKIMLNDYNPGTMALTERKLLIRSIKKDGVTQPIVAHYDEENDFYVVVTGAQRFILLRDHFRCKNVPVVVVQKEIEDRIASTVRHHYAVGKYQVDKMSDLIGQLAQLGWSDVKISQELGMEAEAVLRMKRLTGLSELFTDQPYSRAWTKMEKE